MMNRTSSLKKNDLIALTGYDPRKASEIAILLDNVEQTDRGHCQAKD